MNTRMKSLPWKFLFSAFTIILSMGCALAQNGIWSGAIDVQGQKLTLVFNLTDSTLDVPDQGAKGIQTKVERGENGNISIFIPKINASFKGTLLNSEISGTFTQHGISLPLTLKQGEELLNRPQTPKGPFPYATENVSFKNGDACLSGTLTLPKDWKRSTPVFIMITGSGIQDRDETVSGHKPFAVIADALARNGIATLRYDDRGFGESTGDLINVTTEDLINDALAGIRLLRERFDKVGAIGHSEGGAFALILAAKGEIDYAISLAGMAVSGKEILLAQNKAVLEKSGADAHAADEDIRCLSDKYMRCLSDIFDAVINGKSLPSVDDYSLPAPFASNISASYKQLQTPYMKSFLALEPRLVLSKITCPVLAMNGTKDTQVDCTTNLEILKSGLGNNGTVEKIEGVNHLFQHCTTGEISEYKQIEETFAPEVLDKLINWILSVNKN